MASPQKENGYTAIANEIMDALMRAKIPSEPMRVLMCILRNSYGWNRAEAKLTNKQISEATGMLPPHVSVACSWLNARGLVVVTPGGNKTAPRCYKFNKNYDKWLDLLPQKVTSVVTPEGNNLLPQKVTSVTPEGNNFSPEATPANGSQAPKTVLKQFKTKELSGVASPVVPPEGNDPETAKPVSLAERLPALAEFVLAFHGDRRAKHPTLLTRDLTAPQVEKCIKAVDQMIRIDGYDLEATIKPALRWAARDEFWSRNTLSLAGLRDRSKNGLTKIQNILSAWEKSKAVDDPFANGWTPKALMGGAS